MSEDTPDAGGLFTANRARLRELYHGAWRKRQAGQPLEPLEVLIATVVEQHPEYHDTLARDDALDRDFPVDAGVVNPYLHMGLHLAVREQVATDRPSGMRAAYQDLVARLGSVHQAEHAIMECLAQGLWEGQRQGRPPDETAYIECLERLVRTK